MGMHETGFKPTGKYAFPHAVAFNGDPQALTLQDDEWTDFTKPAGGIWSTAHDMALYIITELKGGINAEGKRVFDEHNLMYRRTPQVQIDHNAYYGLGWSISDYKGLTQISHAGATIAFSSWIKFIPEKKSGFVILTNRLNAIPLNKTIEHKIFELWFGTNERSSERLAFAAKQVKKEAEEGGKGLSEPNAEWMKPFLGKHENNKLGIFNIEEN